MTFRLVAQPLVCPLKIRPVCVRVAPGAPHLNRQNKRIEINPLKKAREHDCKVEECRAHKCKPMAASTVRQIHAIISGTLDAAERWDWISSNPARVARKPRQKAPEPDPPTPQEAARLSEEAFRMDDDWGTLVWLAMTTGLRRGELVGLRFSRLDLDTLRVYAAWVAASDRKAAEILGSRMPKRPQK
jgi:integrase